MSEDWEPMEKDRILFKLFSNRDTQIIHEATVTQIERTETSTYIKLGAMGWFDRDTIKLQKLL